MPRSAPGGATSGGERRLGLTLFYQQDTSGQCQTTQVIVGHVCRLVSIVGSQM